MKTILLLSISLLASTAIMAQKKLKKPVYFINPEPIENEVYKCTFKNAVSDKEVCKFGAVIQNLTDDYLIIQLDGSSFKLNGEEFKTKEKRYFIEPYKTKTFTYSALAEGERAKKLHAREMEFTLGGVLRIPAKGKIHQCEDFKLPVSKNVLEFEDFKLTLKNSSQETKLTVATFELQYTGKDFAIVDPKKISTSIPDVGSDIFANTLKKGTRLLKAGESMTLKVAFKIAASFADMQFSTMMIHFNDAFQTSASGDVAGESVKFELDPNRTKGKH